MDFHELNSIHTNETDTRRTTGRTDSRSGSALIYNARVIPTRRDVPDTRPTKERIQSARLPMNRSFLEYLGGVTEVIVPWCKIVSLSWSSGRDLIEYPLKCFNRSESYVIYT